MLEAVAELVHRLLEQNPKLQYGESERNREISEVCGISFGIV